METIEGIQFAELAINMFLHVFPKTSSVLTLLGLKMISNWKTKRIDVITENKVKPIVTPNVPVPIKTSTTPKTIFDILDTMVTIGRILVFREDMMIERNRVENAEETINTMAVAVKLVSVTKVVEMKSFKIRNRMLVTNTPADVSKMDALTNSFESANLFSEKLLPKNLWIPVGIPREAAVTKIVVSEIIVDEVPMMSGVVNLDIINQNPYPASIAVMLSISRYAAPLPTFILLKFPDLDVVLS